MTTKTVRKARPTSKPKILLAAVVLAKSEGLRAFSREQVAKASKVAEATISFHFRNMDVLRRDVVAHAIEHEVLPILADARIDRKSAELYTRMPAELKEKVAAFVSR